MVTIINRMLGRILEKTEVPGSLYSLFSDLPGNHWAFAAMLEAAVAHDHDADENGERKRSAL